MTTPENDELLTTLEGTHRLTAAERNDAALRSAIWLDFFGGSVATAVLAALVAGLSPLTWDHMMTIPGYVIMGLAVFGAAFLLARWSGVRGYVVDSRSVIAEAESVNRSWAVPRTQVASASVSRGSFVPVLTLSLQDGTARVIVLPESMRRALGLEGGARAASEVPPNEALHQSKRGVEDGPRRP